MLVKALMIVGISMLVGCKSLSGNLEIDTPFFDISYEGKAAE